MNAQARILKAHPLLSLLPRAVFNELIAHATTTEFSKGSVIYRENKPCEGIFLLLSGRCERFQTLSNGREKVLNILGPGDVFGDHDLLYIGHNDCSVRVLTKGLVLRVNGAELRKFLTEKIKANGNNPAAERFFQEPAASILPPQFGRVVALASLAASVPDELILENLAQTLHSATGESVLVADFVSTGDALLLRDWPQIQRWLSSGEFWEKHLHPGNKGFNRMAFRISGDAAERSYIAPLLSQLGRRFRYVLLHLESDAIPLPPIVECIVESDVTYLLLEQSHENLRRCDILTREVHSHVKSDCIDFRPVVYVAEGTRSREFFEKVQAIGAARHVEGSLPNGFSRQIHCLDEVAGSFSEDIRRLAREIGRCRVGLALSAGAARGLSHVGVIQVLEENGIEIDAIAGSSMGAYVASLYAYGCNGAHLEKLAREMESRRVLWRLLDICFPPRRGFVHGRALRNHLKKTIGGAHFCDMVRPLRIVATHLDFLERVVFSFGEVAEAVHASSAIPGICVPLRINGETYIDGGLVDPLPVDVLQEMGIEKIIAVNTFAPPEQRRYWLQKQREEIERARRAESAVPKLVSQQLNYFERGNILDVIMRGIMGAQIRTAEDACSMADVVLRPIGFDTHAHEFSNPGKYIALGRKVAEERLEELKALVNEKGMSHEISPHPKMARAA